MIGRRKMKKIGTIKILVPKKRFPPEGERVDKGGGSDEGGGYQKIAPGD